MASASPEEEFHDEDEMAATVPWFVTLVVRFPWLVLAVTVVIAATTTAFSIVYFELSDPLAGLRIRDDVIAERADAWYESLFVLRPESGTSDDTRQPPQSVEYHSVTILYVAPGLATRKHPSGNIFTVGNLQKMAKLEDSLQNIAGYNAHCLQSVDDGACMPALSPLRYLREAKSQAEIDAGLRKMWADREAADDPTLFHFCKDFNNETNLACPMTRTKIRFGLPLAGYLNSNDRLEVQTELLANWFWDQHGSTKEVSMFTLLSQARQLNLDDPLNEMVVTFDQDDAFIREAIRILAADALYAGLSVLTVVIMLSVHMGSVFLGFFGTFQILLSFPVCYFIYRVVFGIELFGALSVISVYILLGIATDDIFLIADAFRQSRFMLRGPGWTLEKRATWAFRRAAHAMASTTVTTLFVFLVLTSSPIPAVSNFGVWMALLLVTNFALACTFFLALIVIHERLWQSAALQEGHLRNDPGGILAGKSDPEAPASRPGHAPSPAPPAAPSRVERFFREFMGARIVASQRVRTAIFFNFAAVTFAALAYLPRLEMSTSVSLLWPEDHHFGILLTNNGAESFKSTEETAYTLKVVWGLDDPPINRDGTSLTDVMDFGTPIFDADFDLEDEDAQVFLRDICVRTLVEKGDSLFLDDSLAEEDRAKCFMLAFANWRRARNESFPIPNAGVASLSGSVESSSGIRIPARAQQEVLGEALVEFLTRPEFAYELYPDVGFERLANGNMRVRFAVQQFAVNATYSDAFTKRTRIMDAWDAYLDEIRATQPVGLAGSPYYTEMTYFVWRLFQQLFRDNVIISITSSMAIAFVVIALACRNWILSAITVTTVALVVIFVTASVVWSGYMLGIIECVALSVSFGVAIDFSLHMCLAYSDAHTDHKLLLRKERVLHAYLTLGTSITFGALSTVIASSMLLFATITLFSVFAWIFCVTLIAAYVYAIVLLPAVLAAIGPEGGKGSFNIPGLTLCFSGPGPKDYTVASSIRARSSRQGRQIAMAFVALAAVVLGAIAGAHVARSRHEALGEADDVGDVIDESYNMPAYDTLEEGQWTEMRPGNASICARGTPFAFYVRKGAPDAPMIIEWQGGGACWSASTCEADADTFADTIDATRAGFRRIQEGSDVPAGLADPDGPYANFTHVYIPYCTADLHAGNNTVDYTDSLRIHHQGNANVGYALDFVATEMPAPPRALLTGCSAGSYASFWHAPRIIKMFEAMGGNTTVMQMGDSGMGIVTDDFLAESFPNWKVTEGGAFDFDIVPAGVTTDPLNLTGLTFGDLYQWAAETYPSVIFSQFTSSFDWIQTYFYLAQKLDAPTDPTGQDKMDWNEELQATYDALAASDPPNLFKFIGPGDHHCVVSFSRYYTADAGNGTPLFQIVHDAFLNDVTPTSTDCRSAGTCEHAADLREKYDLLL